MKTLINKLFSRENGKAAKTNSDRVTKTNSDKVTIEEVNRDNGSPIFSGMPQTTVEKDSNGVEYIYVDGKLQLKMLSSKNLKK